MTNKISYLSHIKLIFTYEFIYNIYIYIYLIIIYIPNNEDDCTIAVWKWIFSYFVPFFLIIQI